MKKISFVMFFLLFSNVFLYADSLNIPEMAIKNNNVEAVKQAIEQGAAIDKKIKYYGKVGFEKEGTPLIMAIEFNLYDVARLLIEKGANVNVEGATALILAVDNKAFEMIKLLLDSGAEVNPPDLEGEVFLSPLSIAAGNGSVEIARLLIEKGANVNSKSIPLFSAAYANSIEIARLLIQHGAKVNQMAADGRTPLFMAIGNGSYELAKLLIENGADVNWKTPSGDSLMTFAQRSGNRRIISLLEQQGLRADARKKLSFKQAIITFEYKGSLKGNEVAYIDVEKNKICIETHTYRNFSDAAEKNNYIEICDGNIHFFCNLDENAAIKTEVEGDIFLAFGKISHSPNQKEYREIFLGRDCDVYEWQHEKRYYWQRILLKDENFGSSPLTTYTKEATDIQLDVAIPPSKFELPKGIKIITQQELAKKIIEKYNKTGSSDKGLKE